MLLQQIQIKKIVCCRTRAEAKQDEHGRAHSAQELVLKKMGTWNKDGTF